MDLEKYTERSKGFVQSAQNLALRSGHQRLAPEHLAKVLLEDKEGLCANLIRAAGGDSQIVLAGVDAELDKQPKVEGAGAGQVYLGPELARIFDQAEKVAEKAALEEPPKEAKPTDVAAERVGPKEEPKTPVAKKIIALEDEEEEEDEKPEREKPPAGPPKTLDPQLYKLLEDPLRTTRRRYLPPGKYTVEIRAGSATEKTTLEVKPETERPPFGED